MDPRTLMRNAFDYATDGDYDDAAWCLADYLTWKRRGGAVTPDLDRRAVEINELLEAAGHPGVNIGF